MTKKHIQPPKVISRVPSSSAGRQDDTSHPLVSVVIPVYNGAPYLEAAVASVQKSTYQNFEVLIIDDGSTDKSRALCRQIEKKHENVRFFGFSKNRGLGRVLNYALKQAKGEYICRINQDDEMHKTRIKKQVDYLEAHPEVVLLGSWLIVDEDGELRLNEFLEHDDAIRKTWLRLSPCWDAAVMYRKEKAIEVGGYEQEFWPADDLHMWYKLGQVGKIANLQEPLTKIKFHTKAASVKHHKKHVTTTHSVHQWAHKHVDQADLKTKLFWYCELLAGNLLPAWFNWQVYRFVKRYLVYSKLSRRNQRQDILMLHASFAA